MSQHVSADCLNDQQERFCQEYMKDVSAQKAAQRAGYSSDNPPAAAVSATRLLKKAKIQDRINELKKERAAAAKVTAEDILLELKRLALVDISQAYDAAGFLKPIHEIPEDCRRALSGLETSEIWAGQGDDKSIIGHTKKARFYDKTRSLELLGKHLKMYTDKIEHSGTLTLEQIIAASHDDEPGESE